MALPSPDELIYRGVNEVARDGSRILPEGWDLIRGSMAYAGEAGAAAEGAGAVDVAVAAASSLVDGTAVIILGLLVLVLYLSYYTHALIRYVVGLVPLGVGRRLQAIVDFSFAWEAPITGWVAKEMNSAAMNAMHGFVQAVQWAVGKAHGLYPTAIDAKIENAVRPAYSDLAHLHVDFNHLWDWVDRIAHVVGHEAVAIANPGGAIADQVHELQREMAQVQRMQLDLVGSLTALDAQVANVEASMGLIASHVVGVRAVNVGFQDLVTQVGNLTAEVHELQTTTKVTVDTHTGAINTLFPLGILLDAGAVGLRNLRKLEDNPCQCPRFPGVINELGLAMGVLHHLKGD